MPPSNRKIRARLSSEGGNIPRPFRPYGATPSTLSAFLSSSLLSSFSILFSFPPFFFIFLNDTRDPTALRNRAPFMAEFVTLNWRSCATTTTTNDPRGFRTVKFRGFFFTGWFTGSWQRGGHRVTFERDFSWIYGPRVLTTSGFINTNISSSRWFFLLFHISFFVLFLFFLINRIYLIAKKPINIILYLYTTQFVLRG